MSIPTFKEAHRCGRGDPNIWLRIVSRMDERGLLQYVRLVRYNSRSLFILSALLPVDGVEVWAGLVDSGSTEMEVAKNT